MNANAMAGALVAVAVLAGCGGGSSGASTPPASTAISSLEGVYQGGVSDDPLYLSVVLENGQYYAPHGQTTSEGDFVAYGLLQGSVNARSGNFTSTDTKDFYKDGTGLAASISASYTTNESLNGTVTGGYRNSTFSSKFLGSPLYNYNTPANLEDIVGSWPWMGTTRDEYFALTISSTGTITGISTGGLAPAGCTLTGSIQPRPSGKNVFNVSLTFGPAPCTAPTLSVSGIGISFAQANGRHELVLAGTDATRTNATVFAGAR